ncbi:Uncharacterised protein [Chlamydia trachomatis]|nr:Uncharacterised protein [Chlamydia trachomatis]
MGFSQRRETGRYGEFSIGVIGLDAWMGLMSRKSAPLSAHTDVRSARSSASPSPHERAERVEYSCADTPQRRLESASGPLSIWLGATSKVAEWISPPSSVATIRCQPGARWSGVSKVARPISASPIWRGAM